MLCETCGIEAVTKHVEYHQNIGALIMRFHKTVEGEMCKSCVHKYFWQLTLTNLFLGWWGVISLFLTPIFILNNLVRYTLCLGMAPVPRSAQRPMLTEQVIAAIQPHAPQIIDRLNAKENLNQIAKDTSYTCGATPGQVLLYIHALLQAAREKTK